MCLTVGCWLPGSLCPVCCHQPADPPCHDQGVEALPACGGSGSEREREGESQGLCEEVHVQVWTGL